MKETITRKDGDKVIVTLPADSNFNFEIGKEYFVSYEDGGIITLIPKIEDPFKEKESNEYHKNDVWDDMQSVGKEIIKD